MIPTMLKVMMISKTNTTLHYTLTANLGLVGTLYLQQHQSGPLGPPGGGPLVPHHDRPSQLPVWSPVGGAAG